VLGHGDSQFSRSAFGANAGGPTDVSLHGHPYILQQGWSNLEADCAWSLARASFTLTAQPSIAGDGLGSIAISPLGIDCDTACAVSFPASTVVTLTAAPATGSAFAGWSGACAGVAPCTVTMSAARDVTALFSLTACNPRPQVAVSVTPSGAGRLLVSLSSSGANNALQSIQFGSETNALVDIGLQTGRGGNFGVALAPSTQQATFYVRRATQGAATTVALGVNDSCGSWSTFVGAGASTP
jgi:hypothetical protein